MYVRSKFTYVRSSHDLSARAQALSLEGTLIRGHPFMTPTRKSRFLTPCPYEPDSLPFWTSIYHRHKIHFLEITRPSTISFGILKLKFNYNMIVICLKLYYL